MIATGKHVVFAIGLALAVAGCQADATNRPVVVDTSDGQALPQMVITGGASQANMSRSVTVAGGQATKLNFFSFANPDCSNVGYATIREIIPPQHGKLEITKTEDFGFWPEKNPRFECNRKRVKGIQVRYIADPGFAGTDSLTFEMFGPTQGMRSFAMTVNVL